MRRTVLVIATLTAFVTLGLHAAGCSAGGDDARRTAEARTPGDTPVAKASATPKRRERPLPAFEGYTLDDRALDLASLIGRRALLFFFDPTERSAAPMARAVARIAREGPRHNFEVVGVSLGERSAARRFVETHDLGFRVIDDARRRLASRLGLTQPTALLLSDAAGYVVRASTGFPDDGPDPSAPIEAELREWLRLPGAQTAQPVLGDRPLAPVFEAPRLDGGDPFDLASTRGRPLVLIFFLHTCPHCHEALKALRADLAAVPEATRPALVGVSVMNRPGVVRERLAEDGLDFFPVVFDPEATIRAAYGAQSGVPEIFLIDAAGRIQARVSGWREDRDPPLMRMRIAKLAGQSPPMLLHRTGYSGDEFCAVCHESQHETWLLTEHGHAFDTLVRHGADHDVECVGCHVVGFGETGGYSLAARTSHLEDVGCETCHGRGGPHLSPGHVEDGNYEPVCVSCHDPKHSLGFDYASFLPRVSHAANAHLAGLSLEEKRALLAKKRQPRAGLLPSQAAYVGSEACQSCHPSEHATWSGQPHARAWASLEEREATGDADCLRCHTTGYQAKGGFPTGGSAGSHPALAAVGCESCHGPGGDHVEPNARRIGTIVSLGDKCDSCVILQICGSCHDEANDPGFEFVVQEKIDAQRHGTIEPGTGRPKGAETAARPAPGVLLEEAFRRLDAADS